MDVFQHAGAFNSSSVLLSLLKYDIALKEITSQTDQYLVR